MLFSGLQRFWSSVYHCHEDSSGLFEETQKSRKNSFCPCIACLVEMDGEILLLFCQKVEGRVLTAPNLNKKSRIEDSKL